MHVAEQTIHLQDSPTAALQRATRALQLAGFKKTTTDSGMMMVSSRKFKHGQYNRVNVSITITPTESGSDATVMANNNAHSVLSAVSPPSERMVNKLVGLMQEAS